MSEGVIAQEETNTHQPAFRRFLGDMPVGLEVWVGCGGDGDGGRGGWAAAAVVAGLKKREMRDCLGFFASPSVVVAESCPGLRLPELRLRFGAMAQGDRGRRCGMFAGRHDARHVRRALFWRLWSPWDLQQLQFVFV